MKRKFVLPALFPPLQGNTFPSHKGNVLHMAKKKGQLRLWPNWSVLNNKECADHELNSDLISHNAILHKNESTCSCWWENHCRNFALILPKEMTIPPGGMLWPLHPLWPLCCSTTGLPGGSVHQELRALISPGFNRTSQFTVHLSLKISTEAANLESVKLPSQVFKS